MAVTYPLLGSNASINSLGSTNFYSVFLAAITPASARVSITNNAQDTTGIGAFSTSELPGLLSATATIGGYAGSTAYLGNVCGVSSASGTTPMYAVDIQSFDITLQSKAHDITKYNSGSPPSVMDFRPDIIQARASITAMVDQGTAMTRPDIYTNTLNTFVITYGSSNTLTLTAANVRTQNISAVKGNKQVVQYTIASVGSFACSGGLFNGKTAFGTANNTDPLWNGGDAGTTPAGAAVFYWIGGGARSCTFQDSFWTAIRIRSNGPGAPVMAEMDLQARGTITLA